MKLFTFFVTTLVLLTACCEDGMEIPHYPIPANADRTVLIYMASENDLSDAFSQPDISEMKRGSKSIGKNNNLIVYVDEAKSNTTPYLLRLVQGTTADSIIFKNESLTSDPNTLRNILLKVISRYPAKEYALCLWGHADGWIIEEDSVEYGLDDVVPRSAYGRDTGNNSTSSNGKWMNIPTMARVFNDLPVKLKYIFCDCCNMMCAEVAYELRNATEYLIGSPAEIPGAGAPYQTIVPAMMEKVGFAEAIVDNYFNYYEYRGRGVPLSVVKMGEEEMTQLAEVTKEVLYNTFHGKTGYPETTELIYYLNRNMYDMNDIMLRYASSDDYARWKAAVEKVVVHKKMATRWMTNGWINFNDFTVTEERYGGISMFIPQQPGNNSYAQYNQDIKKMAWYYAAGYADIGW